MFALNAVFFPTRLFYANNVKLMPLNTMDWDQTICTFTVLHQVCCCLIGSALFLLHVTSSDIMPAKWPGFHSAQRLRQKKTMEIAHIFPCIFNYILLIQCDFNSITFGIEFRQIDSEYPIWCGTIFGRNFGISWVNLLFISSKILNSSNFPAIHHKNDGFSAMSQFFLSVIAVEWQPWSEIGCSHKAWQASKWTWHFV